MGIYIGPFRFTKRGVRVRIGPRALRLHVGAGGTGISSGAGPFTIYRRLGKRRRPAARRVPAAPQLTAPATAEEAWRRAEADPDWQQWRRRQEAQLDADIQRLRNEAP